MCLHSLDMFLSGSGQSRFSLSCDVRIDRIACHIGTRRTINAIWKHGETFGLVDISRPRETSFVGMSVIGQIQIKIVHVAENHRISFVGYLVRYFIRFPFRNRIPAIHSCCKLVQMTIGCFRMSQRYFLPAAELQIMLLQIVCHLRNIVFRQFVGTCHPVFIHKRPADRRTHPGSFGYFIAT